MKIRCVRSPFSFSLFLFFAVLLFSALACTANAHAQSIAATWLHGQLAVDIASPDLRTGSGTLLVELLNPEDKVLARCEEAAAVHSEATADAGSTWKTVLTHVDPLNLDQLVWERLRVRFTFDGETAPAFEQTRAVSEVLRRPVVHILGQSSYLAGSDAVIRILVADSANHPIPGASSVHIELLAADQPARPLFTGSVSHRGAAQGSLDAHLHFPSGLTGEFQLHFLAETPLGAAEFTQPVRLENKVAILLTTEKPLYQPGQTIHVRALALNREDHHASPGALTFEIEDARGNKVFRKNTTTDYFGIASAEFTLADEVNLGAYHLRALMGDPGAPANSAEIAFTVDRYVLPKFKVAVEFDQQNGKPRRDYRPGDHVTGTLRASYFFGEPVAHAAVTLNASAMNVGLVDAGSVSGTTGKDGTWHFDLRLPAYFAGRPLANGAAPVLIQATVKDASGHAESRGEPITVSESSILVTAVPEGGALIPDLENRVFLLAAYPDGTPAQATLTVKPPETLHHISLVSKKSPWPLKVETDAGGVAEIRFIPGAEETVLDVDAGDAHGSHASAKIPLASRDGSDQILLRASQSVLKIGDRLDLTVLSTARTGTAYIDLVREGQTILTRDVDFTDGHAVLSIDVTPQMTGTLEIHAYRFGANSQAIGDRRLVFVQPAEELHIETTADAHQYRPGDEARIHFRVTDGHGDAVHAALGLEIVDEAVIALAEKQPGFAKVFFYLEQELMKPRYEIHSLSMDDVVVPASSSQEHDRDAGALFSSMDVSEANRVDTEFGHDLPQSKSQEYRERYMQAFAQQVHQIADRVNKLISRNDGEDTESKTVQQLVGEIKKTDPGLMQDAWGTAILFEPQSWAPRNMQYIRLTSAGADRQFHTGDDLSFMLQARTGAILGVQGEHPIHFKLAHDRGPDNGLAAISGAVTDVTGAVIPKAAITLTKADTRTERHAITDADGTFVFAALPPGKYRIEIDSPGFERSAGNVTIAARDSAMAAVILNVGSVSQTVSVTTAPIPMLAPMAAAGMVFELAVTGRDRDQRRGAGAAQADAMMMANKDKKAFDGQPVNGLTPAESPASAQPHVRSYFPEALYINPEILTDAHGEASITIPIADSITTWRMAMLASTESGALGSVTSSLKVFQDFFADLDLPVTLTQGDQITIPAAAYNYTGAPGDVELTLQPDDWYKLADASGTDDGGTQTLHVDAGQVGGAHFTLQANHIGKFKLTLSAHMHGAVQGATQDVDRDRGRDHSEIDRRDIVVREIEVVPNGREQDSVFNGRIDGTMNGAASGEVPPKQTAENVVVKTADQTISQTFQFPADAIPDAEKILVRIYPGPMSQVVEGMDALLRMPGGCFEQTSSSTYPNVLALDYMKRTKKLTPEIHAKAEGFIATGYQRLLTFEVAGGGFSWFGNAPANKILTAYGLMEFNDMSKVHDVDPVVIERTRQWLIEQQQSDGSWKPDTSFINEGATNRFNSDPVRITAYIAWALENTGYNGPAVDRAANFLAAHASANADAYTLAVLANFAVEHAADSDFTREAMRMLLDARQEKDNQVWWDSSETGVYATGESASIETTGLAVQALLKYGQSPQIARKALTYIAAKKDANGDWGTTQATIMVLRALLMASEKSSSDVRGTVEIALNGAVQQKIELTAENNDLYQQFVLDGAHEDDANTVSLSFAGSGSLAYQIVGRAFVPWEEKPAPDALSINVAYDRTTLAQNDIVTATATVHNNLDKTANMIMVDLGIPPGFELLSEDLQDFQEKSAGLNAGSLQKFNLTATQAILYFNALAPNSTVELHFRLRAKYPIRAKTFASRVYEYYDPAVSATARPVQLVVH